MSYILDALQRADAERERGHVPGLNSQIVPPTTRRMPARPRRGWQARHTLVLMAALLLAAAGAWWWSTAAPRDASPTVSTGSPPAQGSPGVAPAATPATPTPPQGIGNRVAPVSPAPAAAPPTAAAPVQPILSPPRAEVTKPAVEPVAKATAARAAAPSPAAPTAAAPALPNTAAAAAPATPDANAAPVRSFAELSPEARAQLPPVNVSGSTYSKNAALRMLIVNGKVLQEGQEIAPGFKLETIGQRSAVLNHNGLRYSIGY